MIVFELAFKLCTFFQKLSNNLPFFALFKHFFAIFLPFFRKIAGMPLLSRIASEDSVWNISKLRFEMSGSKVSFQNFKRTQKQPSSKPRCQLINAWNTESRKIQKLLKENYCIELLTVVKPMGKQNYCQKLLSKHRKQSSWKGGYFGQSCWVCATFTSSDQENLPIFNHHGVPLFCFSSEASKKKWTYMAWCHNWNLNGGK